MSEMIERVAKAIMSIPRGNYFNLTNWSEGVARAAIEAMREPTDKMIDAVKNHPDLLGYGDDDYDWIFNVMIDEALK